MSSEKDNQQTNQQTNQQDNRTESNTNMVHINESLRISPPPVQPGPNATQAEIDHYCQKVKQYQDILDQVEVLINFMKTRDVKISMDVIRQ